MRYENQQLFCRCTHLKRRSLLNSAWFFSNCIYIQLGKNSDAVRIKQVSDFEKTLNMENIYSYLSINVQITLVTTSFQVLCVFSLSFVLLIFHILKIKFQFLKYFCQFLFLLIALDLFIRNCNLIAAPWKFQQSQVHKTFPKNYDQLNS